MLPEDPAELLIPQEQTMINLYGSKADYIRATAELNRDMEFYAALATGLGHAPRPSLLLHMGSAAQDLAARRATRPEDWIPFRALVAHRYPHLQDYADPKANDGKRLDSVAELLAYNWLASFLPREVKIETHPLIHSDRKFRADFLLIAGERRLYIEVLGMIQSDRKVRNDQQAAYLIRLAAKVDYYAAHGIDPVIITADVLVDPHRLTDFRTLILRRLTGAQA
jgi:hypothetical protein